LALSGQFRASHLRINHTRIKDFRAVRGVSGIFTFAVFRESSNASGLRFGAAAKCVYAASRGARVSKSLAMSGYRTQRVWRRANVEVATAIETMIDAFEWLSHRRR
jgi:hypothetical protein